MVIDSTQGVLVLFENQRNTFTTYNILWAMMTYFVTLLFLKTNYTLYREDSNSTPNWVLNKMNLMILAQPPSLGQPTHVIKSDKI